MSRANAVYICSDELTAYRCPRCGHALAKENYPGALYCEHDGCNWSEYEPGEFCSPRSCDHSACPEGGPCTHVCNHGQSVVPEPTNSERQP